MNEETIQIHQRDKSGKYVRKSGINREDITSTILYCQPKENDFFIGKDQHNIRILF